MAGGNPRERTALILTVLNEVDAIDGLFESIAGQTLAPDEIVVVDGGSTDGTPNVVRGWSSRLPLRVIHLPGANIARGRNRAVGESTAELIAVTDAGVLLEKEWLERLKAALTSEVDVASGFFQPDPRTTFERALAATTLPAREDVTPEGFLPSSRSVLFRRTAWQRVGGYPEWLDYCEDLVFDLALKCAGFRFAFAPLAVVWFRPRRSLKAFFRQYYLYARGDGKADLWRRRHAIRYAAYLLATTLVIRRSKAAWLLLPLGVAAYTWRPYARLDRTGLSTVAAAYAAALVPAIRLVGDVAKMLGYPVGVWWRLRRSWTSRSSF